MTKERKIDVSIITLIKDTFYALYKAKKEFNNADILAAWEELDNWKALDNILNQAPDELVGELVKWNRASWENYITASVRAFNEYHTCIVLPQ